MSDHTGELPSHPEQRSEDPTAADEAVIAASRKHTRRSFAVAAVAATAGYGFYRWLDRGPQSDGLPRLLDRTYGFNAQVARAVFRDRALAPTYPLDRAEALRVNGVYGLKRALRPESYRLQVVGVRDAAQHPRFSHDVTAWQYEYEANGTGEDAGHDTKTDPSRRVSGNAEGSGRPSRGNEEAGESDSTLDPGTPGLLLKLEDFVPRLPRHELVTQFKCIEGWSQIVHWAGVRMADFLDLYPPAPINGKEPRYVYMETPDGDYYVGYDMDVCRHPQTLLVTEMMGTPLTQYHGAPLRVHTPTRYGYKQIKRVGLIAYTNDKPDDYWTKLGYDWYAGL